MVDDSSKIIGAFLSRQDAEFARRALVEIGRFNSNLVAVVTDDQEENQVDRYFVVLDDTLTSVAQAKTFLKGPMPQMRDAEADLQHEAHQTAERIKNAPFFSGMSGF